MYIDDIYENSVTLLKKLIETPSLSGHEEGAAKVIRDHLSDAGISFKRLKNNTWSFNQHWDDCKPVLLLNSHIDTVKPVDGWTVDPFSAIVDDEKLIGLGSNDAGGPLVSLLGVFNYFYHRDDLPFNLIFAATAEEESWFEYGNDLMTSRTRNVFKC